MVSRFDRGFRFPRDKYADELALYENFRHLEGYLNYIRKKDVYSSTIVVASATSQNASRAHYLCDGNADDVEINLALAELETLGGGKLVLLEGEYDITATLHIPDENVMLFGNGAEINVNLTATGVDAVAIAAGSVSGDLGHLIVITGLRFFGGEADVRVIDCRSGNILVTGNVFESITCSACVNGGTALAVANIVVEGNHFDNVTLKDQSINACVWFNPVGGDARAIISDNVFNNINDDAVFNTWIGYASQTAGNAIAVGNYITDAAGLTGYFSGVQASHNLIDGVMIAGVHTNIDHGGLDGLTDDDHPQYILETLADAKGDLWVASAADTAGRLPVGSNDQALLADSTQTLGVKWADIEAVPHDILSEIHSDVDFNDVPNDGDVLTWVEPVLSGPPVVRAIGTVGQDTPAAAHGDTVAGDLLIGFVESALIATSATGWTLLHDVQHSQAAISAFWKIATGGDSLTPVGTVDHYQAVIITIQSGTFEGLDIFSDSAEAISGASTTTLSAPGITTEFDQSLILVGFGGSSVATGSSPTNASLTSVTELVDANTTAGNDGLLYVISGVDTVAGSVSATTATASALQDFAAITLSINAFGSGPSRWAALPGGGSQSLNDLTDVVITSAADGDIIRYDSASGDWENVPLPGAGAFNLDDADDVTITSPTDGEVLTYDSATGDWINASPAGGALAFNDLTDVVITSVVDGDIVRYDSASGDWLNVPLPAAGAFDLDDADDVVITSPADGEVLTYDSTSGDWINVAPSGGGGSSLFWEAASVGSYDDYFDADNASNWTTVAPASGTATWNYNFRAGLGTTNRGYGVIYDDQLQGDFAAVLKSVSGIAVGDYIQTSVYLAGAGADFVVNYRWTGLAFTDGTTTGANAFSIGIMHDNSGFRKLELVSGDLTTHATLHTNAYFDGTWGTVHLRAIYSASNTWQGWVSLNGEQWTQVGSDVSYSMTPSHAGFLAGTWGGSSPGRANFIYFHSNITP